MSVKWHAVLKNVKTISNNDNCWWQSFESHGPMQKRRKKINYKHFKKDISRWRQNKQTKNKQTHKLTKNKTKQNKNKKKKQKQKKQKQKKTNKRQTKTRNKHKTRQEKETNKTKQQTKQTNILHKVTLAYAEKRKKINEACLERYLTLEIKTKKQTNKQINKAKNNNNKQTNDLN